MVWDDGKNSLLYFTLNFKGSINGLGLATDLDAVNERDPFFKFS